MKILILNQVKYLNIYGIKMEIKMEIKSLIICMVFCEPLKININILHMLNNYSGKMVKYEAYFDDNKRITIVLMINFIKSINNRISCGCWIKKIYGDYNSQNIKKIHFRVIFCISEMNFYNKWEIHGSVNNSAGSNLDFGKFDISQNTNLIIMGCLKSIILRGYGFITTTSTYVASTLGSNLITLFILSSKASSVIASAGSNNKPLKLAPIPG